MNTEISLTLEQIQHARHTIDEFRTFETIGTSERADFDSMDLLLEKLAWQIVQDDLAQFLGEWRMQMQSLIDLNKKIQESYTHLKKISDSVTKVANALGSLIELLTKLV